MNETRVRAWVTDYVGRIQVYVSTLVNEWFVSCVQNHPWGSVSGARPTDPDHRRSQTRIYVGSMLFSDDDDGLDSISLC